MMLKFLLFAYMLHMATAAPQFLTYRDGKFGVNFGGYHAEAGLGGLLTGNAAHGGLSASAGTPYGQRAGAGLGGSVDGNAAGLLYAGAEANPQTGAGVVLGGDTSKGGYAGSQAFAGGRTVFSTKNTGFPGAGGYSGNQVNSVNPVTSAPSVDGNPTETYYNGIQKVRPPKKYLIKPSPYLNIAYKSDNNADHKSTSKPHADTITTKHSDDISSVISTAAVKNANHNGDSNVSDDGAAAVSITVEQHDKQYTVKPIATHVNGDAQHPTAAPAAAAESAVGETQSAIASGSKITTKKNKVQLNGHVPQPLHEKKQVEGVHITSAPPAVVVSRQRLRQKSRTRPNKRERQQQRQRERLVQYAAQVSANAAANANANAADAHTNTNSNTHSNAGVVVAHSKHLTKRVEKNNFDLPAPSPLPDLNLNIGPAVVTSALNIPIGILRSLQESLGGLANAKQGSSVSNQ